MKQVVTLSRHNQIIILKIIHAYIALFPSLLLQLNFNPTQINNLLFNITPSPRSFLITKNRRPHSFQTITNLILKLRKLPILHGFKQQLNNLRNNKIPDLLQPQSIPLQAVQILRDINLLPLRKPEAQIPCWFPLALRCPKIGFAFVLVNFVEDEYEAEGGCEEDEGPG